MRFEWRDLGNETHFGDSIKGQLKGDGEKMIGDIRRLKKRGHGRELEKRENYHEYAILKIYL